MPRWVWCRFHLGLSADPLLTLVARSYTATSRRLVVEGAPLCTMRTALVSSSLICYRFGSIH